MVHSEFCCCGVLLYIISANKGSEEVIMELMPYFMMFHHKFLFLVLLTKENVMAYTLQVRIQPVIS